MSNNSPQPGTNWYSKYEGLIRNKTKPKGLGGGFAQNYIPIKKGRLPRGPEGNTPQTRKSDADQFREAMKRRLSAGMRPGPVNKGRPR
jgi:hypothetical protein